MTEFGVRCALREHAHHAHRHGSPFPALYRPHNMIPAFRVPNHTCKILDSWTNGSCLKDGLYSSNWRKKASASDHACSMISFLPLLSSNLTLMFLGLMTSPSVQPSQLSEANFPVRLMSNAHTSFAKCIFILFSANFWPGQTRRPAPNV
jgi:hypothetical protein